MITSFRWEDLEIGIWVKVFERLDLSDMMLGLPFVCKSWYTASLDPRCWKVIDMNLLYSSCFLKKDISFKHELVKGFSEFPAWTILSFITKRSQKFATHLVLDQILDYGIASRISNIIDQCPALRVLQIGLINQKPQTLSRAIGRCEDLEELTFGSYGSFKVEVILQEAALHCKKLASLTIRSGSNMGEAAKTITLLINLKFMRLTFRAYKKEDLLLILSSCQKLEELYLNEYPIGSLGWITDEDIQEYISRIKTFPLT